MPLLFALIVFAGDIIPMKVSIGDPVLDIEVTSLDSGDRIHLRDMVENSFCFFFSPGCGYCKNAYPNVATLFGKYEVFMFFVGGEAEVRQFLKAQNGETSNVYLVDARDLKTYDIVTLPGAITYKEGKCRTAMHGPMAPRSLARLVAIYEGTHKTANASQEE